jgi:hypothetical protein
MRYANIVHLSDLHLAATGVMAKNQARILGALERDLKSLAETHLKPDIILFSGDLTNAGDALSFSECRTQLYRLLQACNLPTTHLICAPGNHDALQSVAEADASVLETARKNAETLDGANGLVFNDALVQHLSAKFAPYDEFTKTFGPETAYENSFVKVHRFNDLRLAVLSINTALLTTAGSKSLAPDHTHLGYPDLAVDAAFAFCPEGFSTIALGHHPLSMMPEAVSTAMKTLLCKRAAAYLFGHMHLSSPENIQSAAGECKFLQSGALYMGRGRWNGYHVASLLDGYSGLRVTTRKWHEGRLEFGVSTDLSDDGVVYLPSAGSEIWSAIAERPNYRKLEEWRVNELVPALELECSHTLTTQPLSEVYVDPEFERDVYDTAGGRQRRAIPEIVTFDAIFDSRQSLIISAQAEHGKTALVRHWAQEIAKQSAFASTWSVPVILNYEHLRTYAGGIESAVTRRFPNLPDGLRARSLMSAGLVTIFVDDMKLEETREKTALCEFMARFPHCRYILLTSSHFLQMPGVTPVISEAVEFSTIRIRRLKKSQLLTLIEKHGTSDPVKADRLLDRLLNEANSLSVPLTPVSSTFFTQIFTERSAKPVVNRASLIERYVEISLEKYAPEDILSASFDFHNKADLLSDIAEQMCRDEHYSWSEQETLKSIETYLESYELNFSALSLLGYFVSARILENVDGKIHFRLKAFLEYFAARRMAENPKFRSWITDEIRYLQFEGEIASYAAMTRRDEAWVSELVDRYQANSTRVWHGTPANVRDGTILEDIQLPRADASEEEVFAIERRILAEGLTDQARREMLSSSTSPDVCDGRTINRPTIHDPAEQWTTQLNMLSAMAKHMEIIPKDRKRALLRLVINGWLRILAQSLGMVPALAKEKHMMLNGIRYEIHFPENMSIGEITRRVMLSMPIALLRILHQVMGTDKLELQLSQGVGDDLHTTPAAEQFIRVGLLSLLGTEGVSEKLASVAKRLEGKHYLSEALLRQLYELAIRYRLDDGELSRVRHLAGNLAAKLEAVPPTKKSLRRDQIIEWLTKDRLIVEMKPKPADLKKIG